MYKFLLVLGILGVTLSAKAQLFKKYRPGCYYDSTGVKHEGFISKQDPYRSLFRGNGDHIFFKTVKDTSSQKIYTDQLTSVVIKKDTATTDSFVVSHTADLEKYPFLKVLVSGRLNVYSSTIQSSTYAGGFRGAPGMEFYSSDVTYYYGPDPNHLTQIRRRNFIEAMSTVMSDKPLIVDKIKSKYFRYGDMIELAGAYRTGILPTRSETED
jgi:hypothetical protein